MRHFVKCFDTPHSPLDYVDTSSSAELRYHPEGPSGHVSRPFLVHANGPRKKPFLYHRK